MITQMFSIVLLETEAPSRLADELIRAGYQVWEALAISEVLYLCETEWVDIIVVAPGVKYPNLNALREREITVQMEPGTTAKQLLWELSKLFPDKNAIVQ